MTRNTKLPLRSLWLVAVVVESLLKLSYELGRLELGAPIALMGVGLVTRRHNSAPERVFTVCSLRLSCVSGSLLIYGVRSPTFRSSSPSFALTSSVFSCGISAIIVILGSTPTWNFSWYAGFRILPLTLLLLKRKRRCMRPYRLFSLTFLTGERVHNGDDAEGSLVLLGSKN